MIEVTKKCEICGKTFKFELTKDQYYQLQLPRKERPLIQNILPNMPADDRELFISRICGKCFDNLFL